MHIMHQLYTHYMPVCFLVMTIRGPTRTGAGSQGSRLRDWGGNARLTVQFADALGISPRIWGIYIYIYTIYNQQCGKSKVDLLEYMHIYI